MNQEILIYEFQYISTRYALFHLINEERNCIGLVTCTGLQEFNARTFDTVKEAIYHLLIIQSQVEDNPFPFRMMEKMLNIPVALEHEIGYMIDELEDYQNKYKEEN